MKTKKEGRGGGGSIINMLREEPVAEKKKKVGTNRLKDIKGGHL